MKQVFDDLKDCCGCASCADVCPREAIRMTEDALGFCYPKIDQEQCIDCGMCASVCNMQHPPKRNTPIFCLACQSKDDEMILRSSSGGVFPLIAEAVLRCGGAVFGATMCLDNPDHYGVKHITIRDVKDIPLLQGSKYVQSEMDGIFDEIADQLKDGKDVLFSGTPCQVAAVKTRFQKHLEHLYCVDVVCHGVPNRRLFAEYLKYESERSKLTIDQFEFRNKENGWGHSGSFSGTNVYGKQLDIVIAPYKTSYYRFFLDGEINRESCYSCPYANTMRPGDITLGDYWGIDTYNAELLNDHGGAIDKTKGVSCVLVNTEKGQRLLESCSSKLITCPVRIDDITAVNTQLRQPPRFTVLRSKIFAAYAENGFAGVETVFEKVMRKKALKSKVAAMIPSEMKNKIKNKLHR